MSRNRPIAPALGEAFVCGKCNTTIVPPESGTEQRNHCPRCLWSRHVDLRTGDRLCSCRGMMEPIGVWARSKGEWAVIHRCTSCGFVRINRIAPDDDEVRLFSLAARPITSMPFPPSLVFEALEQNVRVQKGDFD